MKLSTTAILGSLAALLILIIGYFAIGVSYKNAEVRQRNLVMAKQVDNTSELDNMMKTITQSSQVTKEEVHEAVMEFWKKNEPKPLAELPHATSET